MVAFLAKPTESEGFEQIVDFLNANPIKYTLTVNPTIYTSCIEQFRATAKTSVRRDLQLEDAEGIECLPNADIFEQLALMGGPIEPIADEAANKEDVPTQSNDPPLLRVNTLGSEEDRLKLKELMDLYTKLSDRVLDLETTKTAQGKEIASLKKRVKKLERKRKSKTPRMKRLFKIGRFAQVVSFEDEDVFNGEEVFVTEQSEKVIKEVVSTAEVSAAAIITTEEITLAQALAELRSAKPKIVVQEPVQSTTTIAPSTIPKAKSITFRDLSESTTRTTLTSIPSNIKDKGKAKMIEPEKPLKMKEQIRLDKELDFQLQVEEEEQARLTREKAEKVEEANISWDNVQEMIEVDRLLAERLQAREQEELIDEEKERLFVELLEKRKKHFATLRAQEKRSKPPTKLKSKSYDEIHEMFDKEMKMVNTFIEMNTELVKGSKTKAEGSSKRACDELEQEKAKKQKGDDDQEKEEMKKHMEIVQDDEVAIDAIPLRTKPLVIVEWKIIKDRKMGYFKLIRADGSSKKYSSMIQMLQNIDREDLETLWKLVKAK
ncbi:hypothetical protein Tco_1414699, partial [Tanacetum coccineum]